MGDSEDELSLMGEEPSLKDIQGWIAKTLLDFSGEKKQQICEKFLSLKPSSKEDLLSLTPEDFSDIIGDLRARRLISQLKNDVPSAGPCSSKEIVAPGRKRQQALTAEFDFSLLKGDLLTALRGREKLNTKQLRELTQIVGKFCKAKKPPTVFMTMFVQAITLNICERSDFKHSILDMYDGKVIGNGNKTLYDKVYHFIENDSRHTRDSDEPPARRKRKTGPNLLNIAPPVTNFDICENSKQILKSIFESNRESWDIPLIRQLLTESFPLQRSNINDEGHCVARLVLNEWPFLYHPIGAALHFTGGNNYNPNQALDEFLSRDVNFLRYFAISKTGVIAAKHDLAAQQTKLLMKGGDTRSLAITSSLTLITYLFHKEDINQLFVMLPDNINMPTVGNLIQGDFEVPSTPCLVGKGSSALSCPEFYVFVDSIRVGGPFSALQGMRVVFPTYFMLNINYNPKLEKTMKFYERAIMKVVSNENMSKEVLKILADYGAFKAQMSA